MIPYPNPLTRSADIAVIALHCSVVHRNTVCVSHRAVSIMVYYDFVRIRNTAQNNCIDFWIPEMEGISFV